MAQAEAFTGSITITRVRGENLPAADVNGKSDPYFVLRCASQSDELFRYARHFASRTFHPLS